MAVAIAVGITGLTLACGADAPPAREPLSGDTEMPAPPATMVATTQPERAEAEPAELPKQEAEAAEPAEVTDTVEPAPPAETREATRTPTHQGPWTLDDQVGIQRMALAESIEKRLPVGETDHFPEGHRVQLFIEASNRSDAETTISVAWENTESGRRSPATRVRIGRGKIYRTRAYRTMRRAGSYRAVVMDADGAEIASLPFTIVESS